jgi:hypothetical protein
MPHDTVKLDLMKQVAANHLNSIPSAKSGDTRAFIEAAANWFGHWWKTRSSWESIAPGYCALVLNHEFAAAGVPAGFSEKLLFRDAPDPNLGGHVHVSDFSMSRVFRDQGGHTDANSICCQLKALNLGTAPCVLFAPETGVMLIAEQGVSGNVARAPLTTFDGNLTVPNVDSLLKGIYDTSLKYPETFPHIWFKKEKFIPIFQAEKLYQNLLYLYLKASTQGTWVVVREDQTNAGRTDLTLTALNPELVFVLEMKVLKSFFFHQPDKPVKKFSEPDNQAWANSGIDQVCDYRTAKQAREAFLLLYDMRKKHRVLSRVCARCTTESVNLRKYDIFNATARDVRAAKPRRPKIR